jgi:hypothetical protein
MAAQKKASFELNSDQTIARLKAQIVKGQKGWVTQTMVDNFKKIIKGVDEFWFADTNWSIDEDSFRQFQIKASINNLEIVESRVKTNMIESSDEYIKFSIGKVTHKSKSKDLVIKIVLSKKGGVTKSAADMTAYQESLQCYYLSLLYNGSPNVLTQENTTLEHLKKEQKFCDTYLSGKKISVEECYNSVSNVSPEWIRGQTFIKTANAIKKKGGSHFISPVYFHRGSPFMDAVYERKQRCLNHDKEIAAKDGKEVKAPSSFSNDKWNPGDIWMTTMYNTIGHGIHHPFPDEHGIWGGKLGVHTCDWDALKIAVFRSAKRGITMGVSLKKIGASANVSFFNDYNPRNTRILEGFTFGQTGDFFSSADMYLHFSGGMKIQFRAFDGNASWQGEIKGTSANAGKIGGGGTNYYTEKHFQRTIGKATKISKGNTHNWMETKNPGEPELTKMHELYLFYINKQVGIPEVEPITDYDEFIEKARLYKSRGTLAGDSFKFSKNMALLFLEAIGEGNSTIGGNFGQDVFRYAQSNTDFSSYFIKVS